MHAPKRFLLTCVLVTLGCGENGPGLIDVPSTLAVARLSLEGPDVQRHAPAYPELSRRLVMGFRNAEDHCVFADSVRLEAGERQRLEALVEHDPTSCRFVVAKLDDTNYTRPRRPEVEPRPPLKGARRLDAPGGSIPHVEGPSQLQTETETQHPSGSPSTVVPEGFAFSHNSQCSAFVGIFVQPVQFLWTTENLNFSTTSRADHFVFYTAADGCVNWVLSQFSTEIAAGWKWLSSDRSHSIPTPMDPNWRRVRATGSFKPWSDTFPIVCGGSGITRVEYENTIDAWYDGYPTFFRSITFSGPCTNFLTPHWAVAF